MTIQEIITETKKIDLEIDKLASFRKSLLNDLEKSHEHIINKRIKVGDITTINGKLVKCVGYKISSWVSTYDYSVLTDIKVAFVDLKYKPKTPNQKKAYKFYSELDVNDFEKLFASFDYLGCLLFGEQLSSMVTILEERIKNDKLPSICLGLNIQSNSRPYRKLFDATTD